MPIGMTSDQHAARATELALEQMDRFDSFKELFQENPSRYTANVLDTFFGRDFEIGQSFLISDHLRKAHTRRSMETAEPQKTSRFRFWK